MCFNQQKRAPRGAPGSPRTMAARFENIYKNDFPYIIKEMIEHGRR